MHRISKVGCVLAKLRKMHSFTKSAAVHVTKQPIQTSFQCHGSNKPVNRSAQATEGNQFQRKPFSLLTGLPEHLLH